MIRVKMGENKSVIIVIDKNDDTIIDNSSEMEWKTFFWKLFLKLFNY